MGYVEKVEVLEEDSEYRIGDIRFSTAREALIIERDLRAQLQGISSYDFLDSNRHEHFFRNSRAFIEGRFSVIHVVRLKPVGDDPISITSR